MLGIPLEVPRLGIPIGIPIGIPSYIFGYMFRPFWGYLGYNFGLLGLIFLIKHYFPYKAVAPDGNACLFG